MCLAVPGKILSVTGAADDPLGRLATVDFQGSQMEASLAMTPEAGIGDWVLVHAGYALTLLDEQEAAETWQWLDRAELVNEMPPDVAAKLQEQGESK